MKQKKGQVSIETLLLAGIIIMITISILGYYTRIMDSTTAIEVVRIETLKQLDAVDKQYYIVEIDNKLENGCAGNASSNACFCIMLDPADTQTDDVLVTEKISDVVEELTNYPVGSVVVTQNDKTNCT